MGHRQVAATAVRCPEGMFPGSFSAARSHFAPRDERAVLHFEPGYFLRKSLGANYSTGVCAVATNRLLPYPEWGAIFAFMLGGVVLRKGVRQSG